MWTPYGVHVYSCCVLNISFVQRRVSPGSRCGPLSYQSRRRLLTSVNTKSIGRPLTSDPLPRHSAIRRLASNGNTYLAARGVDATYILSTSVFIFNQVANPHPGLSLGWLSRIFLLHGRKSSAAVNNDRLLSISS